MSSHCGSDNDEDDADRAEKWKRLALTAESRAEKAEARVTELESHLENEDRLHHEAVGLRARVAELETAVETAIDQLVDGYNGIVHATLEEEKNNASVPNADEAELSSMGSNVACQGGASVAKEEPKITVDVVQCRDEASGNVAGRAGFLDRSRPSEAVPEGLPSVVRFVLRKYEISNVGHYDPMLADALEVLRSVAVRTGVIRGMSHEGERRPSEARIETFDAVLEHTKGMPLLDALNYVATWENERAVSQALRGRRDPNTGALWDTCFRYCFNVLLEREYPNEPTPDDEPAQFVSDPARWHAERGLPYPAPRSQEPLPKPASDYDAGLMTAERIVRSLAKHNADRSSGPRDIRGLVAGALYDAADHVGSAIFTHPQHRSGGPLAGIAETCARLVETRMYYGETARAFAERLRAGRVDLSELPRPETALPAKKRTKRRTKTNAK